MSEKISIEDGKIQTKKVTICLSFSVSY